MSKFTALIFYILFLTGILSAQKVTYSPTISDPASTRFEVMGKAGNYYWIRKSEKKLFKKKSRSLNKDKPISFEIYDDQYNFVRSITSVIPETSLREYFIAGNAHLDRISLFTRSGRTIVNLCRYSSAGDTFVKTDSIASFSVNLQASNILMGRSEDKNKILLLGFEQVSDSTQLMISYMFDDNWKLLSENQYYDRNISQPMTQYEQAEYPLEHFTSYPLKVADSGEWFMICRSAATGKIVLFHFDGLGPGYLFQQVKAVTNIPLDDVALSFSNKDRSVFAGILLSNRIHSLKQVTVAHYSLDKCRIDFDSTYKFKTLAARKAFDENIYEEYFMAVPSKGFMLLKEYGRPVQYTDKSGRNINTYDPEFSADENVPSQLNRNDYTRYNNLAGTRSNFDRGDLSLYFFPAITGDSCWSGILNKQQTDELNSSNLSYVFMPVQNRLVFLYNSLLREYKLSTSTILDLKGNPGNEGVVFWRANNILNFSKARQISSRELAIPYEKNLMNGFAIVKL